MLEIVVAFAIGIMTEIVTEIGTHCSTVARALPIFQRSGTKYIEIAVFALRLIPVDCR